MKRYWSAVGVFVASVSSVSASADNLMQVYTQAVQSDPVFAQAESTWHSQQMSLPIARAGYLPQVSLAANGARNYQQMSPNFGAVGGQIGGTSGSTGGSAMGGGFNGYSWQYGYSLNATQQIYNFAAWQQIKGAKASVKAATANYLASQQSLMQRTATAYFNVLQAYDELRYTIANKRAVWQQFVTAREQFRVGLIAITDEYDARSRYDQVVAQQIAAQNNLNIKLENLRAITGHDYTSLAGLGKHLPMIAPQPANIDTWVQVADNQNYAIKAQNYTVIAAMDNIKQQAAAGYPTLGIQGGVGETHFVDNAPNITQDNANLGLNVAYNPIQGGGVIAATKKARYDYVTASAKLDQVHRDVVNQARSSFLSVLSNSSQIKADKQSIISAKNALSATEAGLKVGTRTMVDVLDALKTLYQSQKLFAIDQYAYINNLIALKAAAGTLSVVDLQKINAWLGKSVVFPSQDSVGILPTQHDHAKIKTADDVVEPEQKTTPKKAVERKHTKTVAEKHKPVKTAEKVEKKERVIKTAEADTAQKAEKTASVEMPVATAAVNAPAAATVMSSQALPAPAQTKTA